MFTSRCRLQAIQAIRNLKVASVISNATKYNGGENFSVHDLSYSHGNRRSGLSMDTMYISVEVWCREVHNCSYSKCCVRYHKCDISIPGSPDFARGCTGVDGLSPCCTSTSGERNSRKRQRHCDVSFDRIEDISATCQWRASLREAANRHKPINTRILLPWPHTQKWWTSWANLYVRVT